MITYQKESGIISLHTAHTTYQMQIDKRGCLLHLYYGSTIHSSAAYTLGFADRGFSGNPYDVGEDRTYSLDALPMEYPFWGGGDYRNSAFCMKMEDGSEGCDLRFVDLSISDRKYMLETLPCSYSDANRSVQSLKILLRDDKSKVETELLYGVFYDADIITRAVRIVNRGDFAVRIQKAASVSLDFLSGKFHLMNFYGRHAMERNRNDLELSHGTFSIGSNRGTSSHQQNPFVILKDFETTENSGICYGIHLVYSGNFKIEALVDQYNQTRITAGLSDENFSWILESGETFETPEAVLSFCADGLCGLTHVIHDFVRNHIIRGYWKDRRRPILINNWEATYFDFDGEKILSLARQAKELGIEMLVLDDGWFGKRNTDSTSLGDWIVNTQKLGCTMGELSHKISQLGLLFGLWFEPEAISEDSDLYRLHPDFCLRIPGRAPVRARYQLVLDFSRKEVVDAIFKMITEVLDHADISYLKWDMNRSLSEFYSNSLPAERQQEVSHRYMLGVYDLLNRLTLRYPKMLIEGCSGGGGRFDLGMLSFTPQIWCSDNTDAIDRCTIQYGTSFGYPISTMGSHVSASPNHQTMRTTPFHTRTVVAMAGSFGYELDLSKLDETEKNDIRKDIELFKNDQEVIHAGDYYRLTPIQPSEEIAAWMFISKNKTQAVISAVALNRHGNQPFCYIRPRGLDASISYRIEETGECIHGSTLMNAGILLPTDLAQYEAVQFHLSKMTESVIL